MANIGRFVGQQTGSYGEMLLSYLQTLGWGVVPHFEENFIGWGYQSHHSILVRGLSYVFTVYLSTQAIGHTSLIPVARDS